jgi:predicted HicB family RNase H-like nuclease
LNLISFNYPKQKIIVNDEAEIFYSSVLGIKDVITFQGRSYRSGQSHEEFA